MSPKEINKMTEEDFSLGKPDKEITKIMKEGVKNSLKKFHPYFSYWSRLKISHALNESLFQERGSISSTGDMILQNLKIKDARLAIQINNHIYREVFGLLNIERMKRIGVVKFEWLHSGVDCLSEPLHKKMNGNEYEISSPPIINSVTKNRGYPGEDFGCRCLSIAVIDFD